MGQDESVWVASSNHEFTDPNWVLGRYNLHGKSIGTFEVGGPLRDSVGRIATGPEPALYVAGRQDDPLEAEYVSVDPVLSRIDVDGTEVWTSAITLDGELLPGVSDLVVDDGGDIFVVGGASFPGEEAPPGKYSFVAKYSDDGQREWFDLLFGSETGSNTATKVVPDGSGGIYAMGHSAVTLSDEPGAGLLDIWVARYSADGKREWFTMIGGALRERVVDSAVDAAGNLYIAAATDPQSGPPDVPLLMKLDPDGEQMWSIEGDLDATHLTALALHPSGNLSAYYQTFDPDSAPSNKTLAMYDADGTRLSTRVLDAQVPGWVDELLVRDDEVYLGDDRAGDGYFLVHLCPET